MLSRVKKKKHVKSGRAKRRHVRPQRPFRFNLETLCPRLLFSANIADVDLDSLYDHNLKIFDYDADGTADSGSDAQSWSLDDSLDKGYGLPSVVGFTNNEGEADADNDQMRKPNGHPVWCMCPECMGLTGFADESADADSTDMNTSGEEAYDWIEAAAAAGGYTLYLDFEGERVYSRPGDFWLGSNFVNVPAYDLSCYGWAGHEQESIEHITQLVQEDYAAYNIAVTNEKPASGDYTTIYVGGNNDWFRANSGVIGVASYDIGNRNASNYGFAFSEELSLYQSYSGGNVLYFSEYLANLISHEAGHTFGANHVSDTSAIMNPYLPITPNQLMFGSGSIPGSNSQQDTQSLFGNNIGYAHGPDDYGDTTLTACEINGLTSIDGLLERRDDTDAFTFTASTSGIMTVDLDTTVFGNLDSYLTVNRNSDMVCIAQNNNYAGQTDSYVSFPVTAGQQYTIEVSSYDGNSSGTYSLGITQPDSPPQIAVTDSSGSANDLTVDFGDITAGNSETAVITIANDGFDDLVISQLTTNGGFDLDHISFSNISGDDIVIAPGDELQVVATFNPDSAGSYTGEIIIVSNDPQQNQLTVDLSGEVHQPQPDIAVLANGDDLGGNYLSLGNITRNAIGSELFTIQNDGALPLQINEIIVTEPFTLKGLPNDVVSGNVIIIEPGKSIELTVEVTNGQRGILDGQITIISNDPDEANTQFDINAQITGGVLNVDGLSGHDQTIDFGTVYAGENATRTITLTNTGDAELTITSIIVGNGFTIDTNLDPEQTEDGVTLTVGQSLEVVVGCSPNGWEEIAGNVTITTDNIESPQTTINLQGVGRDGALEITEFDGIEDGAVDAGEIWLKNDRNIHTWQLINHGNDPLTISLSLDGADFILAGAETIILAGGESYTVNLTLDTELARSVTNTLTLRADDFEGTTESITITANPYALVGSGMNYSFQDHSGDLVIISLSGSAVGRVQLGDSNQPDIESIELTTLESGFTNPYGLNIPAFLSIIVCGSGTTELGQLSGEADLKILNAPKVNLVETGIDLQGSIDILMLNEVTNGAQMSFSTNVAALLVIQQISGAGNIEIDGDISLLYTREFVGGSLSSDSIRFAIVDNLNADIEVTDGGLDYLIVRSGDLNGNIDVNGRLGSVFIMNGDLLGNLNVENDISRIFLPKGTITGAVKSGRTIGHVFAANLNKANISALHQIDRIDVLENMSESLVSIGSETNSPINGSAPAVIDLDAHLGSISVRGTFSASNIAVG
ncbi:MAG: choice-of-anchor D domain-containing protein, partial [Sedimentisphaerales bacterium]|nr:choice-of-anchor D domain-containing protein [Sedimentisphaerales bacterium]